MEKKLDEIAIDVKEIKVAVFKLTEQAAVHNHILGEHHKRSTALEELLKPLQADYSFRTKLWSACLALASVALAILSYLK